MSENLTVTINCCLCSNDTRHEITMPEGWAHRYGGIDSEREGFCPDHAAIAKFADAQCPGCVGGWGDCGLWESFAYSGRNRSISEADLATIRRGICPKRTNGTFAVNRGAVVTVEDIILSEQAKSGGPALAAAIEAYIKKYP